MKKILDVQGVQKISKHTQRHIYGGGFEVSCCPDTSGLTQCLITFNGVFKMYKRSLSG